MQRLCAAALLNHGETIIQNPGKSNDDLASMDVIQKLGAELNWNGTDIVIHSKGVNPTSDELNCGESGLGLRMFGPIAALSTNPITLKGEGTLNIRPMHFFDKVFPQLGIKVSSNNGKLPIRIQGPLQPGSIKIDGSLSSQFLTGILFAFANACKRRVQIEVVDLASKPYIDLTLEVLHLFGYDIVHNDYREFIINPVTNNNRQRTVRVEGDWSGAAFLLVAAAIAGNATIEGLRMNSTQADKSIIEALVQAHVQFTDDLGGIHVVKSNLQAFEFDATDCPDLFPPLVALASYCKGVTKIKGVLRLKHKESDRSVALQREFGKMGMTIELNDDEMLIYGGSGISGATVHSHHDHRIAMACSVAALGANGSTTIQDAVAINKSYPDFYNHLNQLGVGLKFDQL